MGYRNLPILGSAYWQDGVANFASLPTGVFDGEVRMALDTHNIYYWNGSAWVLLISATPTISIGEAITGATQGSVLFVGPGGTLAQDNSKFFWDDTNFRLGIGTATPQRSIHVVTNLNVNGLRFQDVAPALELYTTTSIANNRSWSINTNYNSSGDLEFLVSTANNTDPSNTVMTLLRSGFVGINQLTPTSMLHIKGASSTSTTFALSVTSASSVLLAARDDGVVSIGGFPNAASVTHLDNIVGARFYQFNTSAVLTNFIQTEGSSFINGGFFGIGTASPARHLDILSSINGNIGVRVTNSSSGNAAYAEYSFVNDIGTTFQFGVGGSGVGPPGNSFFIYGSAGFAVNIDISGRFGINQIVPTARLHAVSLGTTSATYALKVENSSSSNLLSVRDDGLVSVGSSFLTIAPATNTIMAASFQIKNSNGVAVFSSVSNVLADIMPTFGTRTEVSGIFPLVTVGGAGGVPGVTWAPNSANTATYLGMAVCAELNAGGSNSGGIYYGIQSVLKETSVTGFTARKLFSGGLGATNSYTEKFFVNTDGSMGLANTQSTVSGSTSGSAVFSQPQQGASWKRVTIYCSALTGTASYTFPVAFTNTPSIVATNDVAAGVVTARSTTAVTVTGAATTGNIILEGF